MSESVKPKRRVRYKGTHPKKFSEKYKELDPTKYQADLEKVVARGATPAGTHRPICVDEILNILRLKPGDLGLDATLGYGGHAGEILKKITPGGHLIALDQDPLERPKTEARLRAAGWGPEVLTVIDSNFRHAFKVLDAQGRPKVDFVLADLGLSSMQIDRPERGFSFKHDGPLDLRMNPLKRLPAHAWLKTISAKKLAEVLFENADERQAEAIAHAILKKPPTTTFELVDRVKQVMAGFSPRERREEGDLPIKRTFQAIRIAVNDEFGALDEFLEGLPQILKPGGRAAVLSFHSGEDRRVKKSFQKFHRTHVYREVAMEPLRASFEEQRSNPRSKPAKLRWAIRA